MLYPIFDGEKVGYIRVDGTVAIPISFAGGGAFCDGLAMVCVYHPKQDAPRFGVINEVGDFVIPPKFRGLGHRFSNDRMEAKEVMWGYIDRSGEFVIQPNFAAAGTFFEERGKVKQGGLNGFVNLSGDLVIPPRFQQAYYFFNGRAGFIENGKQGFIDPDGNVRIPAILNILEVAQFYSDTAAARVKDSYGLIDKDGHFVVEPTLRFIEDVKENRAFYRAQKYAKYGCMDERGTLLCDAMYEDFTSFAGGLACVRRGSEWFVVDLDLRELGTFRAENAFGFSEGMAMIEYDGGVGYIDQTGSCRVPPIYSFGHEFEGGLALVHDEKLRCYVDRDGNEVWREKRD